MMGRTPALLIAGHGSRSQAGIEEFFALADRVRAHAPEVAVGAGFLELAPPPLSVAAGDLVAEGHEEIVVVPLTLLGAGHAKADIPTVVVISRSDFPGVRFTYARELGIHPDILTVVTERLDATVPPELRDETAVLLVGRGSSDPDANSDILKVARLLWEGSLSGARGWPAVEAAFVGITAPRVPEGLERCLRLGFRRIAVAPYFLFTGILERRIVAQAEAFAAAHPDADVQVTRYLGPDDRVARLVLERYHEAVGGPVPRSCDNCVYRVTRESPNLHHSHHHHHHG
ncbi:MAG: sirohydrochlorin chelatase [Egibacteraceae bacterium]